ncbi:MAG: type II secretion system F family protein [Gammaproteobacteria bacterium]|nr:type II secretion system F family protein [Gammaproteobacteria bacterium]
MPIFYYEGRNRQKQLVKGKRLANSEFMISEQLMNEGITPIKIILFAEKKSLWTNFKNRFFSRAISTDDLGIFARQMYTLTKTGVPIARAIKHLADGSSNKSFANALYDMADNLEAGEDMASTMRAHSRVFPPLVINMVSVGQSSGRLAEAFLHISQYLELDSATLKDLKTALRYPMLVAVSMVVAITLINIFVIPTFSDMFAHSNMVLPLPTKILIEISNFFVHHWVILLFGSIALGASTYFYFKTVNGKLRLDRFLLKVPVLGKIIRGTILMRFAQTFAMTIESGIPLIEGIDLVAESINNEYAKSRIALMHEAVERGNSLTQAATLTNMFNPLELQMLAVSEETGEIAIMLEQIASFYKREVDYDLKRLSSLIEPLLILILSGMVLVLALAVYLPIWNMSQMAKGG